MATAIVTSTTTRVVEKVVREEVKERAIQLTLSEEEAQFLADVLCKVSIGKKGHPISLLATLRSVGINWAGERLGGSLTNFLY